jgi:hypothetical protein
MDPLRQVCDPHCAEQCHHQAREYIPNDQNAIHFIIFVLTYDFFHKYPLHRLTMILE